MAIVGTATDSATSVSSALSFTIKELSGEGRLLELVGRALPYRPIEFPGTMRATVTYYAGNPIGSMQVLGAQEEQTTITGFWKDRFVMPVAGNQNKSGAAKLNDQLLGSVGSIVATLDDFRRKGQLIEVTWGLQVRHGIIAKFVPKWHNIHDAEFEVQFTWISQGEPDQAPTFYELDQQAVSNDLNSSARQVSTDIAGTSFASDLFAQVKILNAQITAAAKDAEATIEKTAAQVLAPIDAATAMLGVLEHAITAAQGVMDFTQAQVDRRIIGINVVAYNLGQTLIASQNLRGIRSDARKSRSSALQHREGLRNTTGLRSAPQSHTVRQGEDLRTVSTNYYGNPNDWRRIALFNNLDGAQVAAGTVILVPPAKTNAT